MSVIGVIVMTSSVSGADPVAEPFGRSGNGENVEAYTLKSGKGLIARVMTRGATLVELHVPDRDGKSADVILGFDDVSGYESDGNQYFGCTTGRVCNRIAKGRFTLDGKEYTLAINNEPNHLHGGVEKSLDKVLWKAHPFSDTEGQGVRFTFTSPDGDEGYPGNLALTVVYHVPKDRNEMVISYEATTDRATPVNLTNHAYFNLSGAGAETVLNHHLELNADTYTPTDETLIPTGEFADVEGTDLDFRRKTIIGSRIENLTPTAALGYDHNFVLRKAEPGQTLTLAAVLSDPVSGRVMRIATSEPAVQFYSGNFLKGQTGKGGKVYPHRSALCLETQHHPDSVNHRNFPTTILRPGQQFTSRTTYSFSVE